MLIQSTPKTPFVHFDFQNKTFVIKGISCPENPMQFYTPIFEELKKYLVSSTELEIVMQLDYFNTGSSKCLLNLFQIISDNATELKGFVVHWITEEGDDELREAGKIFEEMSGLSFFYEDSKE
ncbi:MAG: DUF1987 domain-containing protein [Flavobacteriia bacterium]|nr:DUF1987 domain-containing protein [Flavobacteriia bacterium]